MIGGVQATITCTPSSIIASGIQGSSISFQTTICANNANETVNITKSGTHFEIDQSVVGQSPAQQPIQITFNNMSAGFYQGSILFSSGQSVPVNLNITSTYIPPQPEQPCRLIELPHTSTFRITQNEKGSSSIIKLKVASQCNQTMEGMTVSELTQMAKPMFLQATTGDVEPGSEFSFSIGLDAIGVSTGTYQNSYVVSGSIGDNVYSKTIQLSTIVSIGTSPIDSNSFTNLPKCTIESNMALNTTYSLVCTIDNPNLDIEVPYNSYFKGSTVTESAGRVEYKVIPAKTGETNFLVNFKYKDLSIGDPFIQKVKITQGSVPLTGNALNILFYQNNEKKELNNLSRGNVTILVKDNTTDSIVNTFTSHINGQLVVNSFFVEPNKNYELIVDADGYLSKTLAFNIAEIPININITPSKSSYFVGDSITIATDVLATLSMNNISITSPYTFTTLGINLLKVSKEGYTTTEKNISVESKVSYTTMTPLLGDWKKGKEVIIELTKNATWNVMRDGVQIAQGEGTRVQFKIEEIGTYSINTDGYSILTQVVESKGFLKSIKWYWWVGGLSLLGIFVYSRKKNSSESVTPLS